MSIERRLFKLEAVAAHLDRPRRFVIKHADGTLSHMGDPVTPGEMEGMAKTCDLVTIHIINVRAT